MTAWFQKIAGRCSGHQRTFTLPMMYFSSPQSRLSELEVR
jgi:hypothetical protein